VQRDDETETAIMNRLDTYNRKTSPLIGFYEAEGLLKNFLSLSSKDTVAQIGLTLSR
jgi:adenylate kinase